MSEPGPEQEAAQAFARQLFGPRREPEPKGEPSSGAKGNPEPEPKAEPSTASEDPEQAHNAFLLELFRGSAEKREADREFFGMPGMQVPPPDEGE